MKERKDMKPKIQIIHAAFAAFAFASLAFMQNAQAVSPSPDGGYPGGNTAEGQTALLSLTSGGYNTAVGYLSLRSDATGSLNTAVGAGTLLANTADNNTATGAGALFSNTTGFSNTATGAFALFANTTGFQNNAVGFGALQNHSTGTYNNAVGAFALFNDQIGQGNTAFGSSALLSNVSGDGNTAIGIVALSNSTGSNNTALGDDAGSGVSTADHVICIGTAGQNVSNSCYIGGIAGQTVGNGGSTCYVDNDGKLGVFLSARRFKTDIADMAAASEAILCLHPVTFHYKPELDKTGIAQFGLVAEEVAKVNPDLVTHDAKGELSTVRYEAVNAMLLNEFLKEHKAFLEEQRKVEEQQATIAELKKQIETIVAHSKEQDSQIQRVSTQIEMGTATRQMVSNQ
jgi:trimeric autotransporter adhesin